MVTVVEEMIEIATTLNTTKDEQQPATAPPPTMAQPPNTSVSSPRRLSDTRGRQPASPAGPPNWRIDRAEAERHRDGGGTKTGNHALQQAGEGRIF